MIKLRVSYFGIKNQAFESKINEFSLKNFGIKSGDWGFYENGFSCLFVFKKEKDSIFFKDALKNNLGFDFYKINFSY